MAHFSEELNRWKKKIWYHKRGSSQLQKNLHFFMGSKKLLATFWHTTHSSSMTKQNHFIPIYGSIFPFGKGHIYVLSWRSHNCASREKWKHFHSTKNAVKKKEKAAQIFSLVHSGMFSKVLYQCEKHRPTRWFRKFLTFSHINSVFFQPNWVFKA